jgi:hypothetical protein
MNAQADRAEQPSWQLAVVVVVITLACAAWLWWMDSTLPPVPTLCESLASGQLDVTQFTQDMVTAFRAACAG